MWWLLCLLPLVEAPVEVYFEKVKKISLSHSWTMVIRAVLVIAIGFAISIVTDKHWYQGAALSTGIFIASFNYLYNALSGRKMFYLRAKGIDKLYAYVPPWGRIIWELIILGTAIKIYIV